MTFKLVYVPDGVTPILWPLTPREVRQKIGIEENTTLPPDLTEELLALYGYYRLWLQDEPVYDKKTQRIEQNSTPQLVVDKWTMVWDTIALTAQQQAQVETEKWESVRKQRNNWLETSDWTQLSDVDLTANSINNFVTFRQSLRDIPQVQSDPWNITWPEIPDQVKN